MKTSLSQLTTGLVVLGLGVGLLLDSLGFINFGGILSEWWPLFVILLGLVTFMNNPKRFILPAGILLIGVLLQLRTLDIISFDVAALVWPAIMIFAGLSLIFDRTRLSPETVKEDLTSLFVIFAGIETRNKSDNYSGGKATAVLGGITLDLRDATIKKEATLEVFTMMGGLELRVPEGWKVHASGTPVMGGWEDKTTAPTDKNAPILHVNSTCIMGGVEIKN